jgi:glycine/D-amino acid oxidase-like deaminating enzyme/nitrite reductase/ring-hydroxylating ferredoxin subunit
MMDSINQSSGASRSYWLPHTRSLIYEPLSKNIKIDVAVIGGGFSGLQIAYQLLKRGRSVVVIEDGLIASGETSRTSGHVTSYVDGRLHRLKKLFGIESLRHIIQSHIDAIDEIERIANSEGIACEFKRVDGFLFSTPNDQKMIKEEAKALQEIKNLAFEWVDKAPINSFDTGACLKFFNQAQFHPLKFIEGLTKAIIKQGGQIFEGSHVDRIEDGKPCKLFTKNGAQIMANDVVVATNSPINDRLVLQTKLAQYRTYVLGLALPKGEIEEALYWDTDEPYHYIRQVHSPSENVDYFLIGGQDHKTGQNIHPKKAFLDLKKWASEKFSPHEVIYEWSGQVSEPYDRIALIGKNPGDKHVYVHTGASGNGLTYGSIAGMLIPDLIELNKSPLEKIYAPSRKTLKAWPRFLKESSNVMTQYLDWLKPKSKRLDALLPHEGIVQRRGASFVAIYKDVDHKLHRMSAVCPHLGGIVRWNSLEKTWDCPCHGSRFDMNGDVINGPANCGLKKLSSD